MKIICGLMGFTLKPQLNSLQPDTGVTKLRRMFKLGDCYIPGIVGHAYRKDYARGVSIEWLNERASSNRTLLYFHGGAYVCHLPRTYRRLVGDLAKELDAKAVIINFGLAPEHPYPQALFACLQAYLYLVDDLGLDPQNIIFGGDSSGGTLLLSLMQKLRDEEQPLPACGFMFSPCLSFATGNQLRMIASERTDPFLTKALIEIATSSYVGDSELTDPRVSPLLGDFEGLPPLYFSCSELEMIAQDTLIAHGKAMQAGVESTLVHWPDTCHAHVLIPYLPESKISRQQVQAFVAKHMPELETVQEPLA